MSIQKKSLISTLHAAKKANVAKADMAAAHKGEKQASPQRIASMTKFTLKAMDGKSFKNLRKI